MKQEFWDTPIAFLHHTWYRPAGLMVKASVSGSKIESQQLKILGSTPRLVVFCIFLRVYLQNRRIGKEEIWESAREAGKDLGSGLLSDFRLWKVCARLVDERELCGMPGPPAPAVLSDSHILSTHPASFL